MIKGSILLKTPSFGRWINIFESWLKSGHIAMVVHCTDRRQLNSIRTSAANYRKKKQRIFWTKSDGNDLYFIREDSIKKSAVEVQQDANGVIYFYDTEKRF